MAWFVLLGPPLLSATGQDEASQSSQSTAVPLWHYNGFADFGYPLDFDHPSNHLFRSRGTTPHVDELDLNMAGAFLNKSSSEQSRWGMQLGVQGGKDSEAFGFSPTAPNLDGSRWLRHLGTANVSYLAPVGKGLTVQAGLFSSLIGYDSLYAKDNFNYTRPWGADFTPYLMFGLNCSYPLTGTIFVINDYFHLAHPNNVPSWGGQLAYNVSSRFNLKETLLYGPHQSDTTLKFWRFLSDSIAERKTGRLTTALEYQVGTEDIALPASPRALWMAAQLPVHWAFNARWSVTVRPEFCWDRDGRWTGSPQLVKALTSTLEYRLSFRRTTTILRLEHRYDDSRGKAGGFFRGAELTPGVLSLTPGQHLLVAAVIWTFDAPFHFR